MDILSIISNAEDIADEEDDAEATAGDDAAPDSVAGIVTGTDAEVVHAQEDAGNAKRVNMVSAHAHALARRGS